MSYYFRPRSSTIALEQCLFSLILPRAGVSTMVMERQAGREGGTGPHTRGALPSSGSPLTNIISGGNYHTHLQIQKPRLGRLQWPQWVAMGPQPHHSSQTSRLVGEVQLGFRGFTVRATDVENMPCLGTGCSGIIRSGAGAGADQRASLFTGCFPKMKKQNPITCPSASLRMNVFLFQILSSILG